MQAGLPLLSTCTKFFMLFHHASLPSSPALNAGGDRKRGRKGRLVEEWRNIISMRSRRGFVLCRLPSAPSTFPPLSLPSGPGRLWAVSRCTCSELPVCESVTGSVFTSTVCFRGCSCCDSAFWGVCFFCFFASASSAPLHLHPDACCAEDTAIAAWISSQDERESGSSWFCLTCHIATKRALPMLCRPGFIRVCSGALQVHWGWGGGGVVSLRMTGFVWAFESDNQHSCPCTSFCGRVGRCPSESWTDSVTWSRIWTSLEPLFPSAPAAARTPGKTGTVRPTRKKGRKKREMECEWMQCLCLCVTFWSFHDFTLCAFLCEVQGIVPREPPLGFTPCRAASVFQWLSGCVTLQLKQMLIPRE